MKVIAIVGPTAAGKSDAAMALARHLGAEIISVDSMQVYRGMDIGTSKPTPAELAEIRHYLVDVVEPEETFTAVDAQRMGREAIAAASGDSIVLVGGSGLHFRAIVDPLEFPGTDAAVRAELMSLDPDAARAALLTEDSDAGAHVDLANPRRVVRALEVLRLTGETPSERAQTASAQAVAAYESLYDLTVLGMYPGDSLGLRIADRFDQMLANGLVSEVEGLADRLGLTASQAVGYKELMPHVRGTSSLPEAREAAIRATSELGRRQRTWFRRDPRVRWLPWSEDAGERNAHVLKEVAAWSS